MIIRKKLSNGKRSASAWIDNNRINFGVTDYNLSLGCVENDENDDVVITIYKDSCKNANVKIRFMEE